MTTSEAHRLITRANRGDVGALRILQEAVSVAPKTNGEAEMHRIIHRNLEGRKFIVDGSA